MSSNLHSDTAAAVTGVGFAYEHHPVLVGFLCCLFGVGFFISIILLVYIDWDYVP